MSYRDEIRIEAKKLVTRRYFFKECGIGLGSLALADLLKENLFGAPLQGANVQANGPLAPKNPHCPPKAKRVIYLFQAGAPSQLDLFDYKPELVRYTGKPVPQEFVKGINYAFIKPDAGLYASEFNFSRYGQSGAEISEAMPHLTQVADEIAIIRSVVTDAINHAPGQIFMNTGSVQFGRPSMGAWVTYGLGCETHEL